jgi:hypothetical protein
MKTAIQHLKTAIQHLKISSAGFHNFAFYLLTFYFPNQINQFESIMQNKPNLPDAQMNANLYNTTDYENKWQRTLSENKAKHTQFKPNTTPIKPSLSRRSLWRSRIKPNFRKATG